MAPPATRPPEHKPNDPGAHTGRKCRLLLRPAFRPSQASDSTAIRASSRLTPVKTVKSTALPPGRISGQRWPYSPFLRSGTVRGFGMPPAAETRNRPKPTAGVKMMLSFGTPARATVDGRAANGQGRSAAERDRFQLALGE